MTQLTDLFPCPRCHVQAFDNRAEVCELCGYTTDNLGRGLLVASGITIVAALLLAWVL